MIDRRTKNAEIFRDTERRYKTEPMLTSVVSASLRSQAFIAESEVVGKPPAISTKKAKVVVSSKRSLEAAEPYAKNGRQVCVLNFASASNPGGGVVNGSSAQEECICRCSTLYPCLNTTEMWYSFYMPHRKANNPLYNNDCIYTPGCMGIQERYRLSRIPAQRGAMERKYSHLCGTELTGASE